MTPNSSLQSPGVDGHSELNRFKSVKFMRDAQFLTYSQSNFSVVCAASKAVVTAEVLVVSLVVVLAVFKNFKSGDLGATWQERHKTARP